MKKVTLHSLPRRKRPLPGRPAMSFAGQEWVVHTYNLDTQHRVARYLLARAYDDECISIRYKKEILSCFKIPNPELILTLQNNTEYSQFIRIFHKRNGKYNLWVQLKAETRVE